MVQLQKSLSKAMNKIRVFKCKQYFNSCDENPVQIKKTTKKETMLDFFPEDNKGGFFIAVCRGKVHLSFLFFFFRF